jgi:hypothetical protein
MEQHFTEALKSDFSDRNRVIDNLSHNFGYIADNMIVINTVLKAESSRLNNQDLLKAGLATG